MKDILIRLREENRYTQTAMAKLLEVSRQSYMKYETGEVEPPVEVIRKLQKIYNVPYEVLIDNKVDFVDYYVSGRHRQIDYGDDSSYDYRSVASPSPAYEPASDSSKLSRSDIAGSQIKPMEAVKKAIKNASMEEFAAMLFSVATSLQNEGLTLEEKLHKYEIYARLAEAQRNIANSDDGADASEIL